MPLFLVKLLSINIFSSTTEFDSCTVEDAVDGCTKCDTNKNRRLVSGACICENGWFDPGTE